ALEAFRQGEGQAGGNGVPLARLQGQRRILRHRRPQVHAGRQGGLVGRQRQVAAVRQAGDRDAWLHFNSSAMRRASRRATSPLGALSQRSIPWALTMDTVFSAPPITPGWLTSLATIQSQPFLASLAWA